MMVKFHSLAAGEILMFGDVARGMLEIMGKEADGRGVVTVDELPAAIARLKAAIAEDKAPCEEEQGGDDEGEPGIGIARRALPLVELLERSLERGKPVLWGDPREP